MDTHILFQDVYFCPNGIFRSNIALTFTINLSIYTNFVQSSFTNKKNRYGLPGNKFDLTINCNAKYIKSNKFCFPIRMLHNLTSINNKPYSSVHFCMRKSQSKYLLPCSQHKHIDLVLYI